MARRFWDGMEQARIVVSRLFMLEVEMWVHQASNTDDSLWIHSDKSKRRHLG